MNTISALRAERTATAASLRNLLDNRPGKLWNALSQREYDAGTNVLARLDSEISLAESVQERSMDARFDDALSSIYRRGRPVDAMLDTYVRFGEEGFDAAQRQVFKNTMSTTTSSQGGYTVSSNVYPELALTMKRFSAMRDGAQVVPSATGGPLIWPISDGTAEVGSLVAENATATGQDPSFASADMKAYRFSSGFIVAPFEWIQDAAIDVQEFITGRVGARIGRSQNAYFTTGTGTLQPTGFLPTATVGKVAATGGTVLALHADLVDLIGAVDPAYRKNATFMMNDTTLRMVRKIADTTNARPLYLPDAIGPERLLGFPISVNNDMPSPAANVRSIAFGDFYSGYKIVDQADQMMLFRIADSVYVQKGQIFFVAYQRSAGNLLDVKAVQVFVQSAT